MTSEGAISLHGFTQADHGVGLQAYVEALEAFDALGELQELKVLARERTRTRGSLFSDLFVKYATTIY